MKIDDSMVATAINPDQDKADELRTKAVAALRDIEAAGPAELTKACFLMDQADARVGIPSPKRRSIDLHRRLEHLRDQDAAARTP